MNGQPENSKTFTSITERNIQILQMALEYPCQIEKLANVFMMTTRQINRILFELGFPSHARTSYRNSLILERLKKGDTVDDISRYFRLQPATISCISYHTGYKPSEFNISKQIEKVKVLRRDGLSDAEITRQIGSNPTFANQHLGKIILVEKKCKWCGSTYQPIVAKQKYCSKQCRITNFTKKKAITIICKECGRAYKIPLRKRSQKFCCLFCRGLYQRRMLAPRNNRIMQLKKYGSSIENLSQRFNFTKKYIKTVLNDKQERFPPLGWAVDRPLKTATARGRRLIRQKITETRKAYQEWQEQKGGGK